MQYKRVTLTHFGEPEALRVETVNGLDVAALFALLKAGKLKPAIAGVAPLDEVVAVQRRIDAADIAGKVVLDCS